MTSQNGMHRLQQRCAQCRIKLSLTVEVTALDEEGRPSFNLLQNYGVSKTPLVFFVFDLLILRSQWISEIRDANRQLSEVLIMLRACDNLKYRPPVYTGWQYGTYHPR